MPQLLPEGAPATLDNDSIAIPDKLDLAKSVTYKLSGIDSSIKHAEAGSSLTMTINDVDYSIHFVEDAKAHMPPPHIQEIPPLPQPQPQPVLYYDDGSLSDLILSVDGQDFTLAPFSPTLTSNSGDISLSAMNPTPTPSSLTIQRNNLSDAQEESPTAIREHLQETIAKILEDSGQSLASQSMLDVLPPQGITIAQMLEDGGLSPAPQLFPDLSKPQGITALENITIMPILPDPTAIPEGAYIKDTVVTDTKVLTTFGWINNHYIDVSGDDAESYNAETIVNTFMGMARNFDRYKHAMWIENTDAGEITVTSADRDTQHISFEETGGDTGVMLEVTGDNADLIYGARDMQELETDIAIRSAIKVNNNRITLNAGIVTEGTKYVIHFDGNDTQYIAQKGDTINDVVDGLSDAWFEYSRSQPFILNTHVGLSDVIKSTDPLTQDAYLDFANHAYIFNSTPAKMPFEGVTDPNFTVSTYDSGMHDHITAKRDGSVLVGQKQINTLDYSDQDVRLHIDLDTASRATGQWASSGQKSVDYDYISNFHNILSGSGHDYIEGSNADNHISGADGDDMIFGRSGDDVLTGGMGSDTLYGGFDNDTLYGGFGDDMMRGGAGHDTIYDNGGNDRIYGDSGDDIIKAQGGDNVIFGGAGDDHITLNQHDFASDFSRADRGNESHHNQVWGGDGNDTIISGNSLYSHNDLYGGAGDDFLSGSGTLSGHDGDDILWGHYDSDDFLYGQNGADTFFVSGGKDYMFSGGADGAEDRFVFDGYGSFVRRDDEMISEDMRNRIVGFETGIDKIHLGYSFDVLDFESEDGITTAAISIVQSMHGLNIYDVTIASQNDHYDDFGLLVTTMGGTLTTNDFVFNSDLTPWTA